MLVQHLVKNVENLGPENVDHFLKNVGLTIFLIG
jgi:thermostable 8-oxoguanine DNA glycosylase